MKIGYQGIHGSNAETAAIKFIQENNINCDIKKDLIPMISSKNCVDKLILNELDFIVVAFENNIGGKVRETQKAIRNKNIKFVDKIFLPISHSLYKKSNIILNKNSTIVSHPQALKQTKKFRKRYYPNCKEMQEKCTALAAKNLSNGTYPQDYLVICSKNAGEYFNLELVEENIQDTKNNITTFYIYTKSI